MKHNICVKNVDEASALTKHDVSIRHYEISSLVRHDKSHVIVVDEPSMVYNDASSSSKS